MTSGGLAITPGLAYIARAFPEVSDTWIKFLMSGAALTQIPVGLCIGWLTTRYSKRKLLLFSCVVFIVTGLLPFFIHSFPVLLISRILFGATSALPMTLGTSLCYDFFPDENERSTVMGLKNTFTMLGSIFYSYLGGVLSEIGWQYCFLTYLIGFPLTILILIFVPEMGAEGARIQLDTGRQEKQKHHLSSLAICAALLLMGNHAVGFIYNSNTSAFIIGTGFGGSSLAGLLSAISNICGVLGGLLFGLLFKRIKNWIAPLCFFLGACGYIVLVRATGVPMLVIAYILVGMGIAWFIPLLNMIFGAVAEPGSISFTVGVCNAFGHFGQLFSTFVLIGGLNALGITAPGAQINCASYGNLFLALVSIPFILRVTKFTERKHALENAQSAEQ